ncbi:MAG TPA: N-glycosylase/DNA lyase [archaeon]|nr:N-glycosylase/DNA lyase [archaeon]
MNLHELKRLYRERKDEIKARLVDFKAVQGMRDENIFDELCFCTLTPQSKALNCWDAIEELKQAGLLYQGEHQEIGKVLQKNVRFHNNKAKYIVKNRELFFGNGLKERVLGQKDEKVLREWLVENISGYGYKEASHFLRNIGFRDLAILDRHILKNLADLGIIENVPENLTKEKYMEIEQRFKQFSDKVGISMDELDLLFWSMQTGKVFK